MATDDKINYNTILIQHFHLENVINMNFSQVKTAYSLIKVELYSELSLPIFLSKNFWRTNKNNWRTRKKEVGALKALKLKENQQDLKSIEEIFLIEMRTNKIKHKLDKF